MNPVKLSRARYIFIGVVAVISLASASMAPFSKVHVDLASCLPLIYIVAILMAISVYCRFRGMESFGVGTEIVALGFFVTIPILVLSYFSVGFDLPLADDRLAAMDQALGFDWLAFIHFVDARPFLAHVLDITYQTFFFQLLLVPLILVTVGKHQRAYAMITGYAIICVLASFIATFFPAVGTYAHYGLTYQSVSNIDPFFALSPVPDFNAVRGQAAYTLALASASGLLCFPSVHAGVAYLSTWAAWDVKWLRYPIVLLNILMAVAAVSHANHYFVDIIAGFGVSAFVTAVMTASFYEHPRLRGHLSRMVVGGFSPAE